MKNMNILCIFTDTTDNVGDLILKITIMNFDSKMSGFDMVGKIENYFKKGTNKSFFFI